MTCCGAPLLQVVIGTLTRDDSDRAGSYEVRSVMAAVPHPRFYNTLHEHDIGLLLLDRPSTYRPISLAPHKRECLGCGSKGVYRNGGRQQPQKPPVQTALLIDEQGHPCHTGRQRSRISIGAGRLPSRGVPSRPGSAALGSWGAEGAPRLPLEATTHAVPSPLALIA